MQPLQLIALDEKRTHVREDAFGIRITPTENPFGQFIIASVLPPPLEEISINDLVQDIHRLRKRIHDDEQKPSFFVERERRIAHSFNDVSSKVALCATYSMKSNKMVSGGLELVERLEGKDVIVENFSYEKFLTLPNFSLIKENIEIFLEQNPGTWGIYTRIHEEGSQEPKLTPSKLLVRGMIDMFNQTCSDYAYDKRIPTLLMSSEGKLTFGVHKKSKFSGPLRYARSYVNLTNLMNHFYGEEPYFDWRLLKKLQVNFRLA